MKTYTVGTEGKLPVKAKLIYGWGDLFGGGALNLVGFYYLIFLTDVMNINPAWAGLVILVSKIWDAVSDPLMGVITDHTRTRIGKNVKASSVASKKNIRGSDQSAINIKRNAVNTLPSSFLILTLLLRKLS